MKQKVINIIKRTSGKVLIISGIIILILIGKISYLTPLSDIETMLEKDKIILEEKLKTKQDRFL